MAELVFLILFCLGVARITHLLANDLILDRPRIWVIRKVGNEWFADLITCQWCLSIWIAFAASAISIPLTDYPWWHYLGFALAASHISGLTAALEG